MKTILILIAAYLVLSCMTAWIGSWSLNQKFIKNIWKHLLFWFGIFTCILLFGFVCYLASKSL